MPASESNLSTRRNALGALAAGALIGRGAMGATDDPPHFTGFDHVALAVGDAGKSADFYARIFGNNVLKDNRTTRRYLKLGSAYMALAPPAKAEVHGVDHICPGIEKFEAAGIKAYVEHRGIRASESLPGLSITDPDGIQIQLWMQDSWSQLGNSASAESLAASGQPLFRPTGIDHILLDVTDLDKSVAFYEKVFGPVTQRGNNRTWFQAGKSRLGLLPVTGSKRGGVNHFCVSAVAFEYADATRALTQIGAKLEAPEVAGAPEFRDPDGILVQIMGHA
jgi:catechol 2,3-dioxygenase-like lactoylglutathione lyase family enzyme